MRPKVFVLGMPKSGTTSMRVALGLLGYRVAGPNLELVKPLREKRLEALFAVAERYDAFQDDPWWMIYRELDQRYPGSRFILNTRPADAWLESVKKHFVTPNPARRMVFGDVRPADHPERYLQVFAEYHEGVRAYFAQRPGDLLEFRVGEHGFAELCRFLGHRLPRTLLWRRELEFPVANPASLRSRPMRGLWLRVWGRAVLKRWAPPRVQHLAVSVKHILEYRLRA